MIVIPNIRLLKKLKNYKEEELHGIDHKTIKFLLSKKEPFEVVYTGINSSAGKLYIAERVDISGAFIIEYDLFKKAVSTKGIIYYQSESYINKFQIDLEKFEKNDFTVRPIRRKHIFSHWLD